MAKKKPIKATPVTTTAMATVNLDMTLDRDDVVAIQVSEIENKLMTYEEQVSVAIEKLQHEHNAAMKESNKILKDHANEMFGPRLATLRASIAVVEEIGEDKLEVKISCGDGNDCGHVPDDIDDEEYDAGESAKIDKNYQVVLVIDRTKDRNNHRYGYGNEHLYCSVRHIAKPAAYFKLVTVAQKALAGIKENRKLIQKARESLSKMGSLERNCRAELAKMRLKEIGREDVIATISKVGIPGMPQLMQPVLEAPVGKAYPAPK